MKKLITLFALILTLATTTLAKADVCVTTTYPGPYGYHRVYAPVRYERHWVPGRGWVVYGPAHRVLAWNRYHHCWM